jgi:hypothetical protein
MRLIVATALAAALLAAVPAGAEARWCGDMPRLYAYDVETRNQNCRPQASSTIRTWNRWGGPYVGLLRCRFRSTGWEEGVVRCAARFEGRLLVVR